MDIKEIFSQLFSSYGYIVLYLYFTIDTLGIIIPSKSVLSFLGILIEKNVLEFFPVLITAISGSLTGVSLGYVIGRRIGSPGLKKYGKYIRLQPEKLLRAEKWFQKYGLPVIIISYFVPGLRNIMPYLAGMSGLHYYKVILFSAAGVFLWATTFIYLGRFIDHLWEIAR